jgi:Tfp pilus assembly protein PilX
MRRLLQRVVQDERGVALVMALIIMAALAGTTAALVIPGAVNQRNSLKSGDARQAFALAEAALAYGEGSVYGAGTTFKSPITGTATSPNVIPTQAGGGTGTWYATVAPDGITWTIYGDGTVDGVKREVHAQATDPSQTTVTDSGVWNYVYADNANTGCATTLTASITISVPVLIRGDFCIGGSLNFTGAQLQVGGNLSVTGSAKIGASTKKITSLQVGLTSSSTSTCNSVTPGTGACDGSHSPIYATTVSKGLTVTPQMPCIGQPSSWDSQCADPPGTSPAVLNGTWYKLHAYYNAQASLTKSGCPTNLLDNDTTLNNSDTSISSVMFGTTDYDCKVGTNEIKWNHTTKILYVSGTLYFDGSLALSGTIVYTGQASIYFTGGVSMGNNSSFCGIASCTTSWNPDLNGIIFIAGCWSNSTGSTLTTTGCVNLSGGATAQFGVYCTTDYATAGNSSNMGPVLANTLSLGGTAASLIPFHNMPPGTPLSARFVTVPGSPPTNWSG